MRTFLAVAAFLLAAAPGRADFLIDAPATYTPGTAFAVTVGLGPVADLGLYNLELVFRTNGPVAGVLAIDPPAAAAAGYVFPTPDFFLGTSLVGGTDYRVLLSDFTLDPAGTAVVAGVNDRIATLTVRPAAGLTGPIQVFIDPAGSFLDAADGIPLPLGPPASFTIAPAAAPPAGVPAPPGVVCLAVGGAVLVARRRLRRTG